MRAHYGRGPIKAKTHVLDNLIVCVLSDGFKAIERTMTERWGTGAVLEMRRDFQRMTLQHDDPGTPGTQDPRLPQ